MVKALFEGPVLMPVEGLVFVEGSLFSGAVEATLGGVTVFERVARLTGTVGAAFAALVGEIALRCASVAPFAPAEVAVAFEILAEAVGRVFAVIFPEIFFEVAVTVEFVPAVRFAV